jgi:hypothetical protein
MSGTMDAVFPRSDAQRQAGGRASPALLLDFDAGQQQQAEAQEARQEFVATLASPSALVDAPGGTAPDSSSAPSTVPPTTRRRSRRGRRHL